MRALLVAVFLVAAMGSAASADPCRAHCRDVARLCKKKCKLNHPEGASPARHQCLERCELREAECRTRC